MTINRAIANLIELKEALGDKFELKVVNNEELKDSLQFAIQRLDKVEKQEKPKDKWTAVFDEPVDICGNPYRTYHAMINKYYHKNCPNPHYDIYFKKYRYCPGCGKQMIFGDDGSDG